LPRDATPAPQPADPPIVQPTIFELVISTGDGGPDPSRHSCARRRDDRM